MVQYAAGNPVNEGPDEEAGGASGGDAESVEKSPRPGGVSLVVSADSGAMSSGEITWVMSTRPGSSPVYTNCRSPDSTITRPLWGPPNRW